MQQGRVRLVFLDIRMPKLTDLQFLKLAGNKRKVILTTAYPKYALKGYENDVVDPAKAHLLRALLQSQKALVLLAGPSTAATPVSTCAAVTAPTACSGHMFVKGETKNKFLRINYTDILYIEGLSNYVSSHLPT